MKECKKCKKEFEPSKGLINFCSMKCRQGKEWTEEDKQKKSDSLLIKISDELKENILSFYDESKNLSLTSKKFGLSTKVIRRFIEVPERKKWASVKEKNINGVKAWRVRTKNKLVEYKGGKCCKCGYDKCNAALEFHHLNPEEKDFGIGQHGKTKSIILLMEEVNKCILVCANCHREIHAGLV